MNESRYFVYCSTKGLPTKWHENLGLARDEARRLCQLPENRGHEFYVLRAVESVTYRDDPFYCKTYSKKG